MGMTDLCRERGDLEPMKRHPMESSLLTYELVTALTTGHSLAVRSPHCLALSETDYKVCTSDIHPESDCLILIFIDKIQASGENKQNS